MVEYLVSSRQDNFSASKVIGRLCERCKKPIAEGDEVVSRSKRGGKVRVFHKTCWEGMFV